MGEVDGEYSYDAKKHSLNWRLPLIDATSKEGSMEFTIAAIPEDFFPIKVSFMSSKSYCNIEVKREGVGSEGGEGGQLLGKWCMR